MQENKVKEQKKHFEEKKLQKQLERESKIQTIKEKKFEEELLQ